jgi:hypothetical protein
LDYFPRKGIWLFSQERNCVIFLGKELDYFPWEVIAFFPRKGIALFS